LKIIANGKAVSPFRFRQRLLADDAHGDNIESVYWLYNRTGQAWLLNLATNMYAKMARWDTANTLPNWHNVNVAEGFRAPAVFWQQSGNPAEFQFAGANYQAIMSQYGQVPGGGFGGDEVCRPITLVRNRGSKRAASWSLCAVLKS